MGLDPQRALWRHSCSTGIARRWQWKVYYGQRLRYLVLVSRMTPFHSKSANQLIYQAVNYKANPPQRLRALSRCASTELSKRPFLPSTHNGTSIAILCRPSALYLRLSREGGCIQPIQNSRLLHTESSSSFHHHGLMLSWVPTGHRTSSCRKDATSCG